MKHIAAALSLVGIFMLGVPGSLRAASEPLEVTVSILPQKYFVEKIGGDRVHVTVMVEPGADPHVYDPRPRQMVSLTRSKIYFSVGTPFENVWLKRFEAANPGMLIVRTDGGIEKIPMTAHEHHHHGRHHQAGTQVGSPGGEEDDHGPGDPHVWLSPPLVMLQARHILDGLLTVDPANREIYEANYRDFIMEAVKLDQHLLNVFHGRKGKKEFMVFHPAWGYFAQAYGLRQMAVEVEGREPRAADLKRLIEYAAREKIRAIFVQPQFSTTAAKLIADAIGAEVIAADPLAEDWAGNLKEVGDKFSAALN